MENIFECIIIVKANISLATVVIDPSAMVIFLVLGHGVYEINM